MKISSRMKKLLNDQITLEGYASNYYLSMASWAEITGYEGAANFFYNQADEERLHMLKIVHFLNGLGVEATIPTIKQPPKGFKSLSHVRPDCKHHNLVRPRLLLPSLPYSPARRKNVARDKEAARIL